MRLILLFLSLTVCSASSVERGDWELINSIRLDQIDSFSVDKRGQFFIADLQGNIRQYSPDGDSLNIYSPVFRSRISKLEAYWTVSLFSFSADLQRYELLDRFLRPLSEIKLDDVELGVTQFATMGNGNTLWLINETNLELIKWDYRRNAVLQQQPLSLVLQQPSIRVKNMAERKNLLFVQLNGEGVLVFDNQANLIKHLPQVPDVDLFFTEDFILYVYEKNVYKMSYITAQATHLVLPTSTVYKKVGLSESRLFLLSDAQVDIFNIPPGW